MKQLAKQKRKFGFKPVKKKSVTLKELAVDPKTNKATFMQNLIDTVTKNAAVERQQLLAAECKTRLEKLGFEFENDEATVAFFKKRLKIAKLEGNNYVYLDYVSPTNPGVLLIWYNENMDIETKLTKKGEASMKIVV